MNNDGFDAFDKVLQGGLTGGAVDDNEIVDLDVQDPIIEETVLEEKPQNSFEAFNSALLQSAIPVETNAPVPVEQSPISAGLVGQVMPKPEEAAKNYKMSKQLNVPMEVVNEDPDFAEQTLVDRALEASATVAEYFKNSIDNAAISFDDVPSLTELAEGVAEFVSSFGSGTSAVDASAPLGNTAPVYTDETNPFTFNSVIGGGLLAVPPLMNLAAGLIKFADEVVLPFSGLNAAINRNYNEPMYKFLRTAVLGDENETFSGALHNTAKVLTDYIQSRFPARNLEEQGIQSGVASAVQQVPIMLLPAAFPAKIASWLGAGIFGATAFGDTYINKRIDEQLGIPASTVAAALDGFWEFIFEYGASRLFYGKNVGEKEIKNVGQRMLHNLRNSPQWMKYFGADFLGEQATTQLQSIDDRVFQKNATFNSAMENIADYYASGDAFRDAYVTGIATLFQTGALRVVTYPLEMMSSTHFYNNQEKINDLVNATKTKSKSSEHIERALRVMKLGGTVTISGEEIYKLYQENGPILETLGITAEQIAEAANNGQDVKLSLAALHARLTADQFKLVNPLIKSGPRALSKKEVDELDIKADFERYTELFQTTDSEFEEFRLQLERTSDEMLKSVKANAALMQKLEKSGVSPEEHVEALSDIITEFSYRMASEGRPLSEFVSKLKITNESSLAEAKYGLANIEGKTIPITAMVEKDGGYEVTHGKGNKTIVNKDDILREPKPDIKYSINRNIIPSELEPISPDELSKITEKMREKFEKLGYNFALLRHPTDLAPDAPNGANGAISGRTVYIFSDNIADAAQAVQVILDELYGHGGMRLLGKEGRAFLLDLYNAQKEDVDRYLFNTNRQFDLNTDEGKIQAAEEYFSHEIRSNPDSLVEQKWWQSFITTIKNWLRGMGLEVSLNDKDISHMIKKAQAIVDNTKVNDGTESAAIYYAKKRILEEFDKKAKELYKGDNGKDDIAKILKSIKTEAERRRSVLMWKLRNPESAEVLLNIVNEITANIDGFHTGLFHGTTRRFWVFNRKKARKFNDMGAAFYFSDKYMDAKANYSSIMGADVQRKIEMLAAELFDDPQVIEDYQEAVYDKDPAKMNANIKAMTFQDYIKIRATQEEAGHEELVLGVGVRLQRPFIISDEHEENTLFYLDSSKGLSLNEFADFLENSPYFKDVDFDVRYEVVSPLYDFIDEDGSLSAKTIKSMFDVNPRLAEMRESYGNGFVILSAEILRDTLERMGFDGVIDKTVSSKFEMEGIENAQHFITWHPENVKMLDSVAFDSDGNIIPFSKRFDFKNPDIRYSIKEDIAAKEKTFEKLGYTDRHHIWEKVAIVTRLTKMAPVEKAHSELQLRWNNLEVKEYSGDFDENVVTAYIEANAEGLRFNYIDQYAPIMAEIMEREGLTFGQDDIPQNLENEALETFKNNNELKEGVANFILDYRTDQLKIWTNYLESSAQYPYSFKLLIFNAIATQHYDVFNNAVIKRGSSTIRPYAPLNPGAVATLWGTYDGSMPIIKAYVLAVEEETRKAEAQLQTVASTSEGKWIKFPWAKNDANPEATAHMLSGLVQDTPWCSKYAAEMHLNGGDFYVYVTEVDGKKVPRIAVRMDGTNKIGEVSGIQKDQYLEDSMLDVANDFLNSQEFEEAQKWIDVNVISKRANNLTEKIYSNGTNFDENEIGAVVDVLNNEKGFDNRYGKNPQIKKLKKAINSSDSGRVVETLAKTAVALEFMGDDGNDSLQAALDAVAGTKDYNNFRKIINNWEQDNPESAKLIRAALDEKAKENGHSTVVYHGTRSKDNIHIFRISNAQDFTESDPYAEVGFHFGTFNQAKQKGTFGGGLRVNKAQVMKAYAKIQNPFRFEDYTSWPVEEVVEQIIEKYPESAPQLNAIKDKTIEMAAVAIDKFLKEKGHYGGVYLNEHEYDAPVSEYTKAHGKGLETLRKFAEKNTKDSYIFFNPADVKHYDLVTVDDKGKIVPIDKRFEEDNPDMRFQRKNGRITGSIKISDANYLISLFDNADLSTLAHELGHAFLAELKTLADSGKGSDAFAHDYETIKKWLGADGADVFTVEQEEKFARGWERYLMEGHSPSEPLAYAFERFSKWMKAVYKSARSLKVSMSPEIRGVFDRMLGSDLEIDEAMATNQLSGLTSSMLDKVGATDAQKKGLSRLMKKARTAAKSKLARMRAKQKAEFRAIFQKEAEEEADRLSIYRLISALTESKLDYAMVVDLIGKEQAEALKTKVPDIFDLDGLDPDNAAVEIGYDNGVSMLKAIDVAPTRSNYIEMRIEQKIEEVGEKIIEAEEALADSDQLAAYFDAVYKLYVSKEQTVNAVDTKELRERAATVISSMTVEEAVKTGRHWSGIRNMLAKEQKALRENDIPAAMDANRKALFNLMLLRESKKISDDVKSVRALARKINKLDPKKMIPEYRTNLIALVKRMGLLKNKPNVTANDMDNKGSLRTLAQVSVLGETITDFFSDELLDESKIVDYKLLSVEKFDELKKLIDFLAHMGRAVERNLTFSDMKLADTISALTEPLKAMQNKHIFKNGSFMKKILDGATDKVEYFSIMLYTLQQADNWSNVAKGSKGVRGPHERMIQLSLSQAFANKITILRRIKSEIEDSRKHILKRIAKMPRTIFTEIKLPSHMQAIHGEGWSPEEIFCLALNRGSAYNWNAVLRGYDLTQEQGEKLLSKLTDDDWAAVETVARTIGAYFNQISDVHERMQGFRPEKAQVDPFTTASGKQMDGWYYPLIFDNKFDDTVSSRTELDILKEHAIAAFPVSIRRGATIKRKNTGGKPVRLNFSVLAEHVDFVANYISHGEIVYELNKVFNHPEYSKIFKEKMSLAALNALKKTLVHIAHAHSFRLPEADNTVVKYGNYATLYYIGSSGTTPAMQMSGLFSYVSREGFSSLMRGMGHLLRHPTEIYKKLKDMHEMSPYMLDRWMNINREMYEITNRDEFNVPVINIGIDIGAVKNFFFVAVKFVDYVVTFPMFYGTYLTELRKAVNSGTITEDTFKDAINKSVETVKATDKVRQITRMADESVAAMQSSFREMDRSPFLQSRGLLARIFGFAFSFSNAYADAKKTLWRGYYKGEVTVAQLIRQETWMTVLPIIFSWLFRSVVVGGDTPDWEDDETWWDLFEEAVGYNIQGAPLARSIFRTMSRKVRGKYTKDAWDQPAFRMLQLQVDALVYGIDAFNHPHSSKRVEKAAWAVAESLSATPLFQGMPVARIAKRLKEGWEEFQKGGPITAMIFGKPEKQ